ncbi:hypothetical protein HF521_015782 [Silurus meridionalis]|uniref:ZP domain-containing protein n=1 Tax=Silurus meridionalis TaxID=175797 RepID=A0A8T0A6C4_SILME|nr:hypothetical protein HF521_015782 [Silurus meridionalis]
MPSMCRLQSLFLSHNYLASKLQEQEVNGCASSERLSNPEVHVIKLWSAASGLCGSIQVEVSVSLLPPVADAGWCNVVLVLSSAAPVNWAFVTPGLRGHITVYASHSVTPLYPPKPDLTMSSTIVPDLLTNPDLLAWANQNGFSSVTSYTEAHFANRLVVKLKGGGADTVQAVEEAKVEETWLRHWLSHELDAGVSSRKVVNVQCVDGRLAVSVDKKSLQTLTLSISAVTLKDPSCQARSNGSHFLLAFPVISCGTEGEMERHGREVQYRNTILLWRSETSPNSQDRMTEEKSANQSTPLVIHFRCTAPLPALGGAPTPNPSSRPRGMLRSGKDPALGPGPAHGPPRFPGQHGDPLLSMRLFATDRFEQRAVGPCVVTVHGRVYAEVRSHTAVLPLCVHDNQEVGGSLVCVLSFSDPHTHTSWPIIREFCPADPSFIMHTDTKTDHRAGEDGERDTERDKEEKEDSDKERPEEDEAEKEQDREEDETHHVLKIMDEEEDTDNQRDKRPESKDRTSRGMDMEERTERTETTVQLRFSFILRPVFNNSIQFLHCSLQLCGDATETHRDCTHTAALTHTPASAQCEYRNLSRPVLVTYLPDALAGLVLPPDGKLAQKPRETMMSKHSASSGVANSVLVTVIAAFLMGIAMMGALWCIYSCTGRPVNVPRNTLQDVPNSCSPMSPLEQTTSSV